MLTFLHILSWVCSVGIIFCVYMLHRNNVVFKERSRMIRFIYSDPSKVVERVKIFDKYTYNEMLNQFWKPVSSYYRGIK